MMKKIIYIFSIFFLLFSCNPKQKKGDKEAESDIFKPTYNLNKIDAKYILPHKLKEISGLTTYSEDEIICVNDEQGKIFTYNLSTEKITNIIEFGKAADYEGVEIVNNKVYILNSNGKIKVYDLKTEALENIDCSLSEVSEFEGLGYDKNTNCLLLAAKEMKGNKCIYSYNLSDGSFNKRFEVEQKMIEKNSSGKDFKPSGIAVNPITNYIYILASFGKKILVLSPNGNRIGQYNLDNSLFLQPEGICFTPNGDMLISSEGGKGGEGYLLRFNYTN